MFDIVNEHVVRVFDLDALPDGTPFMVMELLEGSDLRQRMPERASFAPEYVAELGRQICAGLMAAHALGVVHRDIKPENIFVTERSDGAAHFKLLDFGISRSYTHDEGSRAEPSRLASGTPAYMSPEQVRAASDFDSRSDIWSLGCVLYELLTGIAPFRCSTPEQSCAAVLDARAVPVRHHRPDVDPRLDTIVMRCMSKEPRDRFASARDLKHALEQWLVAMVDVDAADQGLTGADADGNSASTPGASRRLGNHWRHHVAALVLAACGVIALGLLAALSAAPPSPDPSRDSILTKPVSVLRPIETRAAHSSIEERAARIATEATAAAPAASPPMAADGSAAPKKLTRPKPRALRAEPDVGY
jgi:serine/threonine-protein kinase